MNLEELRSRRGDVLRVVARHGAGNVRVFGSTARGESAPASDVDLLVDTDRTWSLLEHGALVAELTELLGCPVDVAPARQLRPRVRARALREAVPL